MKINPDLIKQGVDDAFTYWLTEHKISFPELLKETIEHVFEKEVESILSNLFEVWLEEHSTQIIAAIAEQHANLNPESDS